MSSLLVQSCSATKKQVSEPTQALDVYDGYFFKIIKKAIREGEFRSDVDLCILSAKYGLLDADDEISTYDRRMTPARAEELRESVTCGLRERIHEGRYETIVLNLGREYRRAVGDIAERADVETMVIRGEGIGTKGRKLKEFVRAENVASVVN